MHQAFQKFGEYVPPIGESDQLNLATGNAIPLNHPPEDLGGTLSYNLGAHAIAEGNRLVSLGKNLLNLDTSSLPELNNGHTNSPLFKVILEMQYVLKNEDLFSDARELPLKKRFDELSSVPFHCHAYDALKALREQAKRWREQINGSLEEAFPSGVILQESTGTLIIKDGENKQVAGACATLMPKMKELCDVSSAITLHSIGLSSLRKAMSDAIGVDIRVRSDHIDLDDLSNEKRSKVVSFILQEALKDIPLPNGAVIKIQEGFVSVVNGQWENNCTNGLGR